MTSYTNREKNTFASRSLGDPRRYAVRTESTDGFIYTASNGQITILGTAIEDENVIIPPELEGLPVTVIGNGAFSNRKMRTITIPESIAMIADGVFCECDELAEIRVNVANPYYQGVDGLLFSKDATRFICYPMGKKETSYTLPHGVTTIDDWAFSSGYLSSVTIPKSVSMIGESVFEYCWKLTDIHVDSENVHYKSIDGSLFNKDATRFIRYPMGKKEASYTHPRGVTTIDDWAFSECDHLESVEILDGVTTIGDGAFYHCGHLKTITIPASVTMIGGSTFSDCNRHLKIRTPSGSTADEYAKTYFPNLWQRLTHFLSRRSTD